MWRIIRESLFGKRERDVGAIDCEMLADGRVRATVIKGKLAGKSAILIPTPPHGAYFHD